VSELEEYQKKFEAVKSEVEKVVVGYEEIVEDFLICLLTGGHLLLEGVPGIAKTTLIKAFTRTMGLEYERIQFTQDMLPADIIGHYYFDQKTSSFELRKGPIFAQVVMADEINRAPPKTQSALIEAMQERQVTIEGTTIELPEPFFVIATKNPIETEGVYPLPEAQLDRFMIKADMTYLPSDQELDMLKMKNRGNDDEVGVNSLGKDFGLQLYKIHEKVHVSKEILEYIRNIVIKTRSIEDLALGASPRAGEHMLYASKAMALIEGRDYVIPDDVKKISRKVLPHRLLLTVDAELEDIRTIDIVNQILEEGVEAPKGKFSKD